MQSMGGFDMLHNLPGSLEVMGILFLEKFEASPAAVASEFRQLLRRDEIYMTTG